MGGKLRAAFDMCLRVLDPEFVPPPAVPPAQVEAAPDAQILPANAVFGNVVRLKAFSGKVEMRSDAQGHAQPVLVSWLDWEPIGRMDTPYYLSFVPVAPDRQAATSATLLQPFNWLYPATCWKPEDGELRDQVEVPLFKSQQGDWWASFALVDGNTGKTLDVVTPDGKHDSQVGIGPFR
ncbi:MAG: hypothetical protein EXR62_05185 [Chloroflexi bacterium]|nr:hypothetical protein [Chloroflexota bacterium]